jgi:hypothetical protein
MNVAIIPAGRVEKPDTVDRAFTHGYRRMGPYCRRPPPIPKVFFLQRGLTLNCGPGGA